MGNNNKYFQTPYSGLGLDLYWEGRPFTNKSPGDYNFESKAVGMHESYSSDKSYIKTSILSKKRKGTNGSEVGSLFVTSNLNVNNDEQLNRTSLLEIITYLKQWDSTYVDFADFAYLKNLGVYPTNRLMIARRFSAPTPNNIYKIKDKPISTLVSWVPEGDDFLSITFKEEWEENTEYSFSSILGDIYGDLPGGDKTKGTKAAKGGFGLAPLAGITEGLQAYIRNALGLGNDDDPEYNINNLPSGNPNLIKESSRRKILDPERTGAGVIGKFSIKFSSEYELKYINGVDPSLVYLDIIQNALAFGTAKSVSILGSGFEASGNDILQRMISGDYKDITQIIDIILNSLRDALDKIDKDLEEKKKKLEQGQGGNGGQGGTASSGTASTQDIIKDIVKGAAGLVVSKYRIRILSVLQVLTGAPSAYWHITVGNPKKPILSSGDMFCKGVTLKLGKVLSYNDLPSTLSIEFELESARNLGSQEIFDRLNTGQSRTYFNRRRAYYDEFFTKGSEDPTTQVGTSVSDREKRFINYTEKVIGTDRVRNPGPPFSQIISPTFSIAEN